MLDVKLSGAAPFSFGDIITGLGTSVAAAQITLDEQMKHDLAVWKRLAAQVQDGPGVISGLVLELLPMMQRLSELSVSMSLDLTQSDSREFSADLNLLGQPVHTFYRQRFSKEMSEHSQITMECAAMRRFRSKKPSENQPTQEEV